MIYQGDSLEILKTLKENSIDSLVTDPPAGINFMGKSWDDYGSLDNFQDAMKRIFEECFMVMKPGAHGLVWAIPRTSHHTAMALERCGFEIRDVITHLFGTGFPKSHDVSKAIDKMNGAEIEVIKTINKTHISTSNSNEGWKRPSHENKTTMDITAPATDEAKQWQGWGTALKPASEHWILIRKPIEKGLTIAENVLKWGVGGINIDECRVEYLSEADKKANTESLDRFNSTSGKSGSFMASNKIKPNIDRTYLGRWPANIILDEQAAEMLDEQSGILKSGAFKEGQQSKESNNNCMSGKNYARTHKERAADSGGDSRFFYVAKASKSERNAGLEGQCTHPTVKSLALMEYLIKLITPPQGTVLDPFMGSGSTGCSCAKLGVEFVGIEREPEYFEIANKRIKYITQGEK